MFYFGYKFVKFFVKLPTFDCKICLFSLKIIPFYCPKTKFKHTLNRNTSHSTKHEVFQILEKNFCLCDLKCHQIVKLSFSLL